MTLAEKIKDARKGASLAVLDAANRLGVSDRQLLRYEASQCEIPQDIVFAMTVLYNDPTIIIKYRQERDLIEQRLGALELNNVNEDPIAALVKFAEELREAERAAMTLISLGLNLQISKHDRPQVVSMMEQAFYDVKTSVAHAEARFLKLVDVATGQEARRRHEEKCLARGYRKAKEKRPALVAERQAEYQIS